MRYKFYREHKYVSFALNDLERRIAKTDFRDPAEVGQIHQEFTSVKAMLEGHAQYENEKLHTLLKQKGSAVFHEAEKDHDEYDARLLALENQLNQLLQPHSEEEQIELGYQFYLQFRKFVGENLLHLHEEETVILPELQRLYRDEELKQVEFATYRIMTQEQLIEMLQVLFPHMNPSDQTAFLSDIKECRPDVFPAVLSGVHRLLRKQYER